MPVDFYELLGVERDAETAEIKQAFRQRAREYHPDVNDDERATAQFTVVRKAYEVLTDDAERADYDRMGHGPYVERRLDGLTKFKYPGKAGKDGGRGESDTGGRSASGRSSAGRSSAGRSASSSSTTSSSSSSSRRSSSASSSSRASRSRASGSSSSSRATGASQSSAAGGSSRGRTRTSESGRSGRTGTTGRFERGRDGSESSATTAPASGATNPLWYGWSVSLVALVAYLGGFAWHLAGDGAGFAAALASLDTAAPAAGLLASSPLSLPSLAALQAAATPAALALPVAAALLAVSLAGVIARFGHAWTTWAYALAAAVPLVLVAAGALGVGRPVAVDLLGFVVCPLLGAGGFVVDAGWYLFTSR
ncbi:MULTISPECIES: J domain-containing protein [Haloferax]|uniref:Chaperone protein DnaJ n=1 Tax=Haloferax massiliensis TaxID=1476858 RepID=A0A0D6JSC6_9EURY|nr:MULTISPECIES: DnaJ domain-containing protein [Haloferax]MDS0240357.1 DnaJ domain-containing protein [Haloferax sp. S2CR25]MDS0443478.1 DnaJ domain-containing protein [Haloferax sp. S2CR25-2]CQR50475.1 Chaperone protein DnaJ [Haloferax massiliensis]